MVNDVNIQGSLFADEPRRDTATCKSRREIHEDYDGFVEKFKPRKTTDDCYSGMASGKCRRDGEKVR